MDSNPQNLIVTILLGALATALAQAQVQSYDLAPAAGARFALEVYKTRLMAGKKHVFFFERYSGEAAFDEHQPEDAKVRFTVEAGSVVCTDTWVDDGSRKKILAAARDLMQPDQYPQMTFASSKVLVKAPDQYDVEGTLTIRGVAKPVVVHVARKPDAFEGEASVKLSDFGLKPPTGLTLGFVGTKDEMRILFRLIPRPKS